MTRRKSQSDNNEEDIDRDLRSLGDSFGNHYSGSIYWAKGELARSSNGNPNHQIHGTLLYKLKLQGLLPQCKIHHICVLRLRSVCISYGIYKTLLAFLCCIFLIAIYRYLKGFLAPLCENSFRNL
ncbi:hypothetical protein L6452_24925 [Arctium lappa]|uniref:Uncharacterized protein n=1 Tax=Arctium lappa TaxID=4217 RepID=A0ACB9AA59_ARCLA|nr:hypothetical protein L6452_24925 [Arctium lappa]